MPTQSSSLCDWLLDAQRLYLWFVVLASDIPHWKRPWGPKWLHFLDGRYWLIYRRTFDWISGWQVTVKSVVLESSALLKFNCNVLLGLLPFQYCMVVLHCDVFGWNYDWRAIQYHRGSDNNRHWEANKINWRKHCCHICSDLRHSCGFCGRFASIDCRIKWKFYVLHIFRRVYNSGDCFVPIIPDRMEDLQGEIK